MPGKGPERGRRAKALLQHLTLVGITKTIGYLPISNLVIMYQGRDFDKDILPMFEKFVSENEGLELKRVEGEHSNVKSGALYIFHRPSLEIAVRENKKMLTDYGILEENDNDIHSNANDFFDAQADRENKKMLIEYGILEEDDGDIHSEEDDEDTHSNADAFFDAQAEYEFEPKDVPEENLYGEAPVYELIQRLYESDEFIQKAKAAEEAKAKSSKSKKRKELETSKKDPAADSLPKRQKTEEDKKKEKVKDKDKESEDEESTSKSKFRPGNR